MFPNLVLPGRVQEGVAPSDSQQCNQPPCLVRRGRSRRPIIPPIPQHDASSYKLGRGLHVDASNSRLQVAARIKGERDTGNTTSHDHVVVHISGLKPKSSRKLQHSHTQQDARRHQVQPVIQHPRPRRRCIRRQGCEPMQAGKRGRITTVCPAKRRMPMRCHYGKRV